MIIKDKKYLFSALPQGQTLYSFKRKSLCGIDKKNTLDNFALVDALNTDVSELPSLRSLKTASTLKTGYSRPLSLHAFDDYILVVYYDSTEECVKVDCVKGENTYTAVLKSGASADDCYARSVVQFNEYTTPLDPLSGVFERKLLFFPDKKYCSYEINGAFVISDIPGAATMPDIRYATVFASRLFGVDGERVYASEFNNYAGWNLDTGGESLASNAWATTTQANIRADGDFKAVITYDGHAVCFKEDFMHQLYNTKNPFRITDIGAYGCINNNAVCEFDGLLAFVSPAGVMLYGGGYPKCISNCLNISDYGKSMLAAYKENLYFYSYEDNTVFVYNSVTESWGQLELSNIKAMSQNSAGAYAVTGTSLLKLNGESYGAFSFTTDSMSFGENEIKRIKGISVIAELGEDSHLDIFINSKGVSNLAASSGETGMSVLRSALSLLGSESFSLTFSGSGYVKIWSVSLKYSKENR